MKWAKSINSTLWVLHVFTEEYMELLTDFIGHLFNLLIELANKRQCDANIKKVHFD